jgi:hypothetical protein
MMPKKVGGLSLILPEDAMKALMSKWIIQALLQSKSNLQIILRPVLHYASTTFLSRTMGSFLLMAILLKLLYQRWLQSLAPHYLIVEGVASTVAYLSPSIVEDIMQLNLWWRTVYQGHYFGITMSRALTLYMKGYFMRRDI